MPSPVGIPGCCGGVDSGGIDGGVAGPGIGFCVGWSFGFIIYLSNVINFSIALALIYHLLGINHNWYDLLYYMLCATITPVSQARVAELVDALASGASVRKNVEVQVLSRAPC